MLEKFIFMVFEKCLSLTNTETQQHMTTIAEFIKKRLIVESDNDYVIDVPTSFLTLQPGDDPEDPNEMQYWMEDWLFPELNEDEVNLISNQVFQDDDALKEALTKDKYHLASKIILAALESQGMHKPREDYSIYDGNNFLINVPLKYLK